MYALKKDLTIVREDGAIIPADPMNSDFQTFGAWVSFGNIPGDYVEPIPATTKIAEDVQIHPLEAGLLALGVEQTQVDKLPDAVE